MRLALLVPPLLLLTACASHSGSSATQALRAQLGIRTRPPTEEQAEALALPFKVRQQCRVVASVSGPAQSAGVRAGDILFAAGDVDLYSQDDLDDVLRVSRPGDELELAVKRGQEPVQKIRVKLGSETARGPESVAWRYASLVNLPRALEEARASQRNVLVGLSGAET